MLIPIVPTFVRSFEEAFSFNLTTQSNPIGSARTIVVKLLPSNFAATGSSVKLKLKGAPGGAATISACYIGLSSTSGSAWNFAATPTAITWDNGQASKTLAAGTEYESDAVSFDITGSQAISIAMNCASGSRLHYATGLGSSRILYHKAGVSEAANTTKGGSYTGASGRVDFVTGLMVA